MNTITYGFSTREKGDMRTPEAISAFLSSLHLDVNNLITAQQTHSALVRVVTEKDKGQKIPVIDGLIYGSKHNSSNTTSIILAVITADCVPLLLYDATHGCIAAVHSGWRGTLGLIVDHAVDSLIQQGARVSNIVCIVGPHIRSCCYSVPEQRIELFEKQFGPEVTIHRDGQVYLDLTFAVRSQLLSHGITNEQIIDEGICTSSNVDSYYSYRKDSKATFGELLGFVALSQYNTG